MTVPARLWQRGAKPLGGVQYGWSHLVKDDDLDDLPCVVRLPEVGTLSKHCVAVHARPRVPETAVVSLNEACALYANSRRQTFREASKHGGQIVGRFRR